MVLHSVPTSYTVIHEPTSIARARCLRERFNNKIDARRFEVGERAVFLPYSREMFDVGLEVGVSYNKAVRS